MELHVHQSIVVHSAECLCSSETQEVLLLLPIDVSGTPIPGLRTEASAAAQLLLLGLGLSPGGRTLILDLFPLPVSASG